MYKTTYDLIVENETKIFKQSVSSLIKYMEEHNLKKLEYHGLCNALTAQVPLDKEPAIIHSMRSILGYSEYINGLDKDYKYLGVRQQFLYFLDQLSVEDIIELRKSRINNPWV